MSGRSESSSEIRETFKLRLTVGHDALLVKSKNPKMTHRWRVFVEGTDGNIAPLVDRMVFHLHPSFDCPVREVVEPPYEISECGFGMFTMKIEIFFFGKPIELYYELVLMTNRDVKSVSTKIVSITNPLPYIRKLLVEAGGKLSTDCHGHSEEKSEAQNAKDMQSCVSVKKKKKVKDDESADKEKKTSTSLKSKHPQKSRSRSASCDSLSSLSSLSPTNSDEEIKKANTEKEEIITERKKCKKLKDKKASKEKKIEKWQKLQKSEKSKFDSKCPVKTQSMSTQSTPKKQCDNDVKEVTPAMSLPKVASFSGLSSKEEKKQKKKDLSDFDLFLVKDDIDIKKTKKERREPRLIDKHDDKKRRENEKDKLDERDKEKDRVLISERSASKSAIVKDTLSDLFGSLGDDEIPNELSPSSLCDFASPTSAQAEITSHTGDSRVTSMNRHADISSNEHSQKKKKEKRKKEKRGENDENSKREMKSKHFKKDITVSEVSAVANDMITTSSVGITLTESPVKGKKIRRKREDNDNDMIINYERKNRHREFDQDLSERQIRRNLLSPPHSASQKSQIEHSSRLQITDSDKSSFFDLRKSQYSTGIGDSSDDGNDQVPWESHGATNEDLGCSSFSSIAVEGSGSTEIDNRVGNRIPTLICQQDDEPCTALFRSDTGVFSPDNRPYSPNSNFIFSQNTISRKDEADDMETAGNDLDPGARSVHSFNSTIGSEVHSLETGDDSIINHMSPGASRQCGRSSDDDQSSKNSPHHEKIRGRKQYTSSSHNEPLHENKSHSVEKLTSENKLKNLMQLLNDIHDIEDAATIKYMILEDLKLLDTTYVGQDVTVSLRKLSRDCVTRIFEYFDA